MKAVKINAPRGLDTVRMVDMEDPGAPGPGEIRVRLQASSLNYHDYLVVTQQGWAVDGRIPMADGAGVVEAVGSGVTEFKTGDMVVSIFSPDWQDGDANILGFGNIPGDGVDGYAREAVVRPATWFTRAPKGWSAAQAATLTTAGVTAWRALVPDGPLKAGDIVLTMGTGGVSIFALQIAKRMGATVIATSSSDAKLERLRAMGADHVINYKTHKDWGKRAFDFTGGQGVDHVVETGGPATLAESITAIRCGGHIALIGVLTGFDGAVPTAALMIKRTRLQGVIVGSRVDQMEMVRAMEATGMEPVIDRSFGLDGISEAFRYEESGQHFGKICLEF